MIGARKVQHIKKFLAVVLKHLPPNALSQGSYAARAPGSISSDWNS